MDLEFASDPSQPTWVSPPPIELVDRETETIEKQAPDMIARAEVLDRAHRQLLELCSPISPLSDLDEFLAMWRDPSCPDRLQPNVLAWFERSEALGRAMENEREDVAQMMLAWGFKPGEADMLGALDLLTSTGRKTGIDLLLEGGWEIDRPINEYSTPILGIFAAQHQNLVKWCLSLGASPNAPGPMGQTPMHYAASSGSFATLKLLVEQGGIIKGTDLVAHAVMGYIFDTEDRVEVIQYLLDNGASIDAYYMCHWEQWKSGKSGFYLQDGEQNALHRAISYGKKELVELLLSNGADTTLKMFSLTTKFEWKEPRELALLHGHNDIAMLL